MRIIEGGICAVRGVNASGIKDGRNGVALITGGGPAAGVFTTNKVTAAPVIVTREHLKQSNEILAIIANSGSANAFTGPAGLADAKASLNRSRSVCKLTIRKLLLPQQA